jgi:two-component system CheB/CheR fusion protein
MAQQTNDNGVVKQRGQRPSLEGQRILLVEDADDVREAFAILLRAEGAVVVAAATGRAAAEAAEAEQFDIVLTDLGLPDIPGEVLILQIIATAKRRPRVVVVTGYDEPYVSRARTAGADVVLLKPVEWTDLLQQLRGAPAAAPGPVSVAA